jgi:histone deacetylase complex regulatory component SIN3
MNENKEISPKLQASIVIKNLRMAFEKNKEYTPLEIDAIANNILAHLPADYSIEEIKEYEKDYLIALDEVKKEFSEKKNLWDTFLDILAGGTHQSPSEKVMMTRWIEGEKVGLE